MPTPSKAKELNAPTPTSLNNVTVKAQQKVSALQQQSSTRTKNGTRPERQM